MSDENILPERKTLLYAYIDHSTETVIDTTLNLFLNEINKLSLFQNLSYILKELIGNANKANLKRVYFYIKRLDIHSVEDYKRGMITFKDDIYNIPSDYIKELQALRLYVKIDFYVENNHFFIAVTNNSPILEVEKDRIKKRFINAKRFKTIEEVFLEGIDTIEGAGLGIILIILTLRKIGLDEKMIKIIENPKYTQFRIEIPIALIDRSEEEFISDAVKKEIKEIPQFPQHISELQKILSNPNATFKDLSIIINRDPPLIADLLKIANSSLYMLPNKVKTIIEAVRQIGFKGVKNLVLSYSIDKYLMNKYNIPVITKIMDHSFEVAYYAYRLSKRFNLKELSDEVYTAAILHDLGKIIINSLEPDILSKIKKVCDEKGINKNILENLTDGYNHSIIGARLAKIWNFPDSIIEAIKYHHVPLESSENNKPLLYLVYIANSLFYYRRKELKFDNINYQVRDYFNFQEKENLDKIAVPLFNELLERKRNN